MKVKLRVRIQTDTDVYSADNGTETKVFGVKLMMSKTEVNFYCDIRLKRQHAEDTESGICTEDNAVEIEARSGRAILG